MTKKFEISLQNLKKTKNLDEKRVETLLNIVKTLYCDVLRDKIFLTRENIKIYTCSEINLSDDEKLKKSANSLMEKENNLTNVSKSFTL